MIIYNFRDFYEPGVPGTTFFRKEGEKKYVDVKVAGCDTESEQSG